TGTAAVRKTLVTGWQKYLNSLPQPPSSLSTPHARQTYRTSQMMLAASEDKTNPGAFIASPSSPWAWGKPGGGTTGYHSVWGRDSYQIATAMLAMGDKAAATRIARHLLDVQSKSDGGAWQYTTVDGTPGASGVQLDQVAFPIVLAWQLGLSTSSIWPEVQAAADYLLTWKNTSAGLTSPATGQERWEEKPGYSPSTIAAQIAGLVCASDIAKRQGDTARAKSYLDTAKSWAASVKTWTLTTSGSLSDKPYFMRISRTGDPNAGTLLDTGNGGPTVDERTVVDAGFLELVRLGILPASDPDVQNTLSIIDSNISVQLGGHTYYYRYNHDGYGENSSGGPWMMNIGGSGRLWPLLSGERGEYNLLLGTSAAPQLAAMVAAANNTGLIAEQIWDTQAPAKIAQQGQPAPKYQAGRGTMSATPLAWSHAQFIRLAWSIKAGAPVEMPSIVRCTFTATCPN
ncbi:MAG: glucoamylase, partial [Actinobacteria bacterium]|nr:glucoamylase [Actinomycetota bacterium]